MLCVSRACLAKSIVFSINLKRLPKDEKRRQKLSAPRSKGTKNVPQWVGWVSVSRVSPSQWKRNLLLKRRPAAPEQTDGQQTQTRTNVWTDDALIRSIGSIRVGVFSYIVRGPELVLANRAPFPSFVSVEQSPAISIGGRQAACWHQAYRRRV
jgi:hypothetical protein